MAPIKVFLRRPFGDAPSGQRAPKVPPAFQLARAVVPGFPRVHVAQGHGGGIFD